MMKRYLYSVMSYTMIAVGLAILLFNIISGAMSWGLGNAAQVLLGLVMMFFGVRSIMQNRY
ncbi:MAG: hypothetical protein GYA50_04035 [Eubacteriaceae bacterium]|nr:hypothetical protein [Eubacteriaceae bacterium]